VAARRGAMSPSTRHELETEQWYDVADALDTRGAPRGRPRPGGRGRRRRESGLPFYVPADPWLYKVARALVRPTVAPFFRFRVSGRERLPLAGPAILAVNHQSDIDPLFIGVAAARPLHYMTEAEKFLRPVLPRVIVRLGAFPIVRGSADVAGIRATLRLLADGEAVVIFPEGDPFKGGPPRGFHPGIGMIAVRSGAPVLPLALTGADRLGRGGWVRRPAVRLTVGDPLDFSGFRRRPPDYDRAAALVRSAVTALFLDGCRRSEQGVGETRRVGHTARGHR
jgi:1-acyl-sn-glycerol-3-phosphate acyltransferase